ncbi:DEAD/DEAH box helicase [Garicola koreensis]|uniref:SNF2 family DNA or RNA helicase n=1 Tax=Garicola koreensis TaxID=1262554 RepID=A0A7W5TVJ3_9MICC|nr:SNF2 family DNA or RNA helicase [Garicola koreensis]
MSVLEAVESDAAFIVSADQRGTRHQLEAVVASGEPGRWYHRVHLEADEVTHDYTAACTCGVEDCVHIRAALAASQTHLPGMAPGRRRTTEGPRLQIGTSTEDGDWFDLNVTVTVAGEQVDFRQLFAALVRGESVYLLPDGWYFPLNTPELETLRRVIEEARTLNDAPSSGLRLSRYQVDLWDELTELDLVAADEHQWWQQVAALTGEPEALAVPQSITADLRDYQRRGYQWLSFLYDHRLGGVLADDMGLGKTLQALTMIQRARDLAPEEPPFLIVAPTSVVGNWRSEAARFAPQLDVVVISETLRRSGASLSGRIAEADVVITSYALFRIESAQYHASRWSGLILDEAQMIKNPASQGYRAARDLSTGFTVAITGTPLENNLLELWALVSLCCPGLLGRREAFGRIYRVPIEKERDAEALGRLQRRLRPFMLRRTKETVAAELPPKQEQVLTLSLHPEHRMIYDRRLQRERQKVLGLVDDMGANRFQILAALNHLRQLALDTELVGETPVPSAKLEALTQMLPEITGEGHRVLVLSQFTRFLSKAHRAVEEAGVASSYLDGSTRERQRVITEFRSGATEAFFISLKAGGFGLNLAEADYVMLLDPWWNPAAEEQAIDRTHRIGQSRSVMVYRLIAGETIESKVLGLQESKRALFDTVLGASEAAGEPVLNAEAIRELLQ